MGGAWKLNVWEAAGVNPAYLQHSSWLISCA